MARMIPPVIAERAAPGEQRVFDLLASSKDTSDWIVLHSLAISNHVRQVQGEADFVVIVPTRGVLVVEVKSHTEVSRLDDGRWVLGKHDPVVRGPFQQADESLHSIRNYLVSKGMDLQGCPFVSASWFTHVRAKRVLPETLEWHSWQLLDQSDLDEPIEAIRRALSKGYDHLHSKFPAVSRDFDSQAANKLAKALRPKFDLALLPGERRLRRQGAMVELIEEQFEALDAMSDNHRVLFEGPAGTGKTLLAVEAARRASMRGLEGRLLCFNRLLSKSLKSDTRHIPGLTISTFHSEMARLSDTPPVDGIETDWDQVVEGAIETLLGTPAHADYLIIDEAQDLVRPDYLDALDLMVKGGLAGGSILFFGDFERQAIYQQHDYREVLIGRVPDLARFSLTVNCRNLPRVGTTIETLSKMEPGYKRYRRMDDGVQPIFSLYASEQDRDRLLRQALKSLMDDGYEFSEIIMLSPLREGSAAATSRDVWLNNLLEPLDAPTTRAGRVSFSTIHSFKGLERPAVILTDLEAAPDDALRSLIYVGASRATDRLTIVGSRDLLGSRLGFS